MQPAFSVIFLTTLIGAGQGLFLALYLTQWAELTGFLAGPPARLYVLGAALAVLLAALGLFASFFHLGHPERAWRAAARWRTSWLSREVIALPAFLGLTALYGAAHYFDWSGTLAWGFLALLACGALFVCTGMIYACMRFLPEWASPLTLVNFVLLGCASGFTLAAGLAAWGAPERVAFYAWGAILLTAAGLLSRIASLLRNARLRPKSTLQSAIGVKHPRIVQITQGFMGGSFNTREFFHGRSRTVLQSVKWGFIAGAFLVPLALLLLALGGTSPALLAAAFTVQYLGLLAERWYFFAQANHPQNLYYQAMA